MLNEIKHLFGKSSIYLVGTILLNAVQFLLLPIYTRFLAPEDFGLISVFVVTISALGILYPIGIQGSITHFYYLSTDVDQRKRTLGTIWFLLISSSILFTIGFSLLEKTITADFFSAKYAPYINLTIWIAFFNVFGIITLNLAQTEEKPREYAIFSITKTLLNIFSIILFVVFLGFGSYGYLLGMFASSILMVIPCSVYIFSRIKVSIQLDLVRQILVYSIPLMPHGLASWMIDLSDRILLAKMVPLEELGIYSMGYQLSTIITFFTNAFNYAWAPYLFRVKRLQQDTTADKNLSSIVTYWIFFLFWLGLGLSLFDKLILRLFTTPNYFDAYRIIPWIVGGLIFNGLYFFPINLLFLKAKTSLIPIVTLLSGLSNVILNILLIPKFGILAAGWATFGSYLIMFVLAYLFSRKYYEFPYEFPRLTKLFITVALLYLFGNNVHFTSFLGDTIFKAVVIFSFPVWLYFTGFLTLSEKSNLSMLLGELWRLKARRNA